MRRDVLSLWAYCRFLPVGSRDSGPSTPEPNLKKGVDGEGWESRKDGGGDVGFERLSP